MPRLALSIEVHSPGLMAGEAMREHAMPDFCWPAASPAM
jgi:hypothetical protein